MKKRVFSLFLALVMCLSLMPAVALADGTATVTFDVGAHGTAIEPAVVTIGGTVTAPTEPTAEGYVFLGWVDGNGQAWNFSSPVNGDITLTARWFDLTPTIALTWLDSAGAAIPGAPAEFTFDLTSYYASAASLSAAMTAAKNSFVTAFNNATQAYTNYPAYNTAIYSYFYWYIYDVSTVSQLTASNRLASSSQYYSYVAGLIFDNLAAKLPENPAYTLQVAYSSYDSAFITLGNAAQKTYTIFNWADKYETAFEDLLNNPDDYLPALVYANSKVLDVITDRAELLALPENFLTYCKDHNGVYTVAIKKYDESVNLTWRDQNSTLLTGEAYPTSYTFSLYDEYFAAVGNIEKAKVLDLMRGDFIEKLGAGLSWDNGYGTWDVSTFYTNRLTADEVFDLLIQKFGNGQNNITLKQHKDGLQVNWGGSRYYVLSDFYTDDGTSELDADKWHTKYTTDLSSQIANAFNDNKKLKLTISKYSGTSTLTEYAYARDEEDLTTIFDGILDRCRDDGVCAVSVSSYDPTTTVNLTWKDKDGASIAGLPASYVLDLSMGAGECGTKFYEEYKDILDQYAQFECPLSTPFATNARDVMAFVATEVERTNTKTFTFNEFHGMLGTSNVGEYTFSGEVAYQIKNASSIDMWAYYDYHWLKTTYANAGYYLRTNNLNGGTCTFQPYVANGKNLLLTVTVTAPATKAITNGMVGLSTDVMIGDNDAATVSTIFDATGKKVGFNLIDEHTYTSCYSPNAKYSCYVAGDNMANAARKILKLDNPVDGVFWYGYYGSASSKCGQELNQSTAYEGTGSGYYNADYTALYNTDSGIAVGWNVNLGPGESQTYCVSFGIVDATMSKAPRFIGAAPQFGEEGFVTVDVANAVADSSSGHYILLSLDTPDGTQLDGGRAYLYNKASKLFTCKDGDGIKDDPVSAVSDLFDADDDYQKNDQVAQFIVAEVNAFPGTYIVTGLTATNDGGEIAEYVLNDEGYENFIMVIPASTRTIPLSLTNLEKLEIVENLREGWSYNPVTNELTVQGLNVDVATEEVTDQALDLPEGTEIVLEPFQSVTKPDGEEETPASVNKVKVSDGTGIKIDGGSPKISGDGSLLVDAPTGIDVGNGDLTIDGSDVEITASVLGVKCDTLTVEEGSKLVVNIPEGGTGKFLDVEKIVIPEGYTIIGGSIDEEGKFTPDPDAKQLVIAPLHTHSFTYEANDNTIIATCTADSENCKLTDHKITLTLTAEGGTYNSTTTFAAATDDQTVKFAKTTGATLGAIEYRKQTGESTWSDPTTTPPRAAGTYKATVTATYGTDETVTAEKVFTVAKATFTPSVSITGWTYGQTANTPSVTGNPANGAVTYFYKVKGADDSTYSDEVPATAGTYTVKAVIAETDNFGSGIATADFTIAQAVVSPTVSITGWTYGETANDPSVTGNTSGGTETVTYKVKGADDSTYSDVKPTDAGTYFVKVVIAATDNYKSGTATAEFTIAQATPTYTVPTGLTAEYTKTLADVTLPAGFTWQDADTTAVGTVGDQTFKVTYTPTDTNYHAVSNIEVTVTVTPKKLAKPTASTVSITYDGNEKTLEVTGYDEDTMSQSGTLKATNVDAYTAIFSLTDKANYTWEDDSTDDATIDWNIIKAKVPIDVPTTYTSSANEVYTLSLDTIGITLDGAAITAVNPVSGKTGKVLDGDPVIDSGAESISWTALTAATNEEDDQYTLTISSDNYEDFTVTVTFTGKIIVTFDTDFTVDDKTYDGREPVVANPTMSVGGTALDPQPKLTMTYYAAGNDTPLTGAPTDAGDYKVVIAVAEDNKQYIGSAEYTFTIEPAEITVSGITAADKQYDDKTDAELDFTAAILTGLLSGDDLGVTATGTFEDANVGKNKIVAISDLALTGEEKDNYVLAASGQQEEATATITCEGLDVDHEQHDWSNLDGKCAFCGLECPHENETDHVCDLCGFNDVESAKAAAIKELEELAGDDPTGDVKDTLDAAIQAVNDADTLDEVADAKEEGMDAVQKALNEAAFEAAKVQGEKDAEAMLPDNASDAAKQLVEDAEAAVEALTYDHGKTLDENKKAIEDILDQLDEDLAALAGLESAKAAAIAKLEELAGDDPAGGVKDALDAAIQAVNDADTIDEVADAKDEGLETIQQALDEAAFEAAKIQGEKDAEAMLPTDAYDDEMQLVEDAKAAIKALKYDDTKTLADNEEAIQGILEQLEAGLAALVGNTDSELEVLPGTPAVTEAGLNQVAEAEAEHAREIKLTMTVEAKPATDAEGAEAIEALHEAQNKKIEYLDITIAKFVDGLYVENVTDTGANLVALNIPFETEGKNISVIRYHGGAAEVMQKDPAAGQEGFVVGTNLVTIYASKFSTYAIVYEDVQPPYAPATYPVNGPESTENGKLSISTNRAAEGEKITLTAKPDEGFELDTITVTDKNGKEIALTDLGNGKFTFRMPAGKVNITASFKAIEAEEPADGPESKPCPMDDTCPIAKFDDTTIDFWWHDGIHYCLENGLMKGVSDTEFDPTGTTSRAMIVTILWRLEGERVANYAMSFSDVAEGEWYTEPIRWAAAEGIVKGYDDGTYQPNKAITREELATILYRYAQMKGEGFVGASMFLMPFEDLSEISDWASEAVRWCFMKGIILGRTETTFVPKATATRAEAATMMQRFCQNIEK